MLGALGFYLALPILYLVSLLPYWLLYGLADGLYWILYAVVRYRRKVVWENMARSFPERSEAERQLLVKKFYRYLADLIFETLKLITISPKTLRKRVTFGDLSPLDEAFAEGRSAVLALGHYGNWEMLAQAYSLRCQVPFFGIYRPLKSRRIDQFLYRVRSRFGLRPVPMAATLRTLLQHRGQATMMGFIADQAPPPDRAHWLSFLNQATPVFLGPEKIARKFEYPVIYALVSRPRRGFYHVEMAMLDTPYTSVPPGGITAWHVGHLEALIQQRPELWMWSHRRWKHRPPADWDQATPAPREGADDQGARKSKL